MPQRKPNILFLMTDQMQARVLDAAHPCITPNLDRLIARGVRITRAYTPNAVCSPARASLMTGCLPHSHGVLQVTHCTHDYHCDIQPDKRHFAQSLTDAGYHTAYFGKWHVDRSEQPSKFGWQLDASSHSDRFRAASKAAQRPFNTLISRTVDTPEGYPPGLFYSVTDKPTESRMCGVTTGLALDHLRSIAGNPQPWCCFVSVIEPHDPFTCAKWAFDKYDVSSLTLAENVRDDLRDKPNIYRKVARVFEHLTDDERRTAMACYYAMVTEVDQQFGRLLDYLDATGQTENTIVVLTSDHGELLGSHGLYMKNYGAFEEVYNIPMVVAGPGVARGATSKARVGLHDLAPTLCDLAETTWQDTGESCSFAPVLRAPHASSDTFNTGYAEYFGTRFWISQRVIWDGDWKLIWNGFDFDELYNLADDPGEMHNRIDDPTCRPVVRSLMSQAYRVIQKTDDHPLLRAKYPALRVGAFGPGIIDN